MRTVKQICFRFGPHIQVAVVVAVGLMGLALTPPSLSHAAQSTQNPSPLPAPPYTPQPSQPPVVSPPQFSPQPPSLLPSGQQPSPPTSVAGSVPQITLSGPNDINTKILCPVFNLMFWVLLTVSIIMVLWAGFQYATAGDDTEKTSSARKTIQYAAIGVVVALVAKGFPTLVGSLFGAGSSQGVGACSGL